jgi:REP element-mobilizing transposase RayT
MGAKASSAIIAAHVCAVEAENNTPSGWKNPAQGNALGARPLSRPSPERAQEKGSQPMPQSLAKNIVHLIFSTKYREPSLTPAIRPHLHSYMGGILRQWESPAILMNSVADHIHILFCLSKNHALKDIVEQVKKGSSKWIKTKGPEFAKFFWQAGYGAFSVSQSAAPTVKRYIENQEAHHRKIGFQEEFRAFLKKYEIDFDERYVWD